MSWVAVIKRKDSREPVTIIERSTLKRLMLTLNRKYNHAPARVLVDWSDDMLRYVRLHYRSLGPAKIVAHLNEHGHAVTKNAVVSKARDMGLCRSRHDR